jgi:ABC-type multidrug transport system ATPase subunit
MKQRLGIAQALLGDPDLLILDEPANGLDPMGVRELRELLFTLKRDYNKTILISSHLLDELQRVCDQIVVMREGELIWDGALDQLASGKNLEDAFVELVSQ